VSCGIAIVNGVSPRVTNVLAASPRDARVRRSARLSS